MAFLLKNLKRGQNTAAILYMYILFLSIAWSSEKDMNSRQMHTAVYAVVIHSPRK
jgi:hypothetical protein